MLVGSNFNHQYISAIRLVIKADQPVNGWLSTPFPVWSS